MIAATASIANATLVTENTDDFTIIGSGSLMVDPACWGHGIGRALTEDMIDWATTAGFHGLQFNAVVESNQRAVQLYRSLGFEVVGTVPEGFWHPAGRYVGLHVMYRGLAR